MLSCGWIIKTCLQNTTGTRVFKRTSSPLYGRAFRSEHEIVLLLDETDTLHFLNTFGRIRVIDTLRILSVWGGVVCKHSNYKWLYRWSSKQWWKKKLHTRSVDTKTWFFQFRNRRVNDVGLYCCLELDIKVRTNLRMKLFSCMSELHGRVVRDLLPHVKSVWSRLRIASIRALAIDRPNMRRFFWCLKYI